jgi:hypothetical protein
MVEKSLAEPVAEIEPYRQIIDLRGLSNFSSETAKGLRLIGD